MVVAVACVLWTAEVALTGAPLRLWPQYLIAGWLALVVWPARRRLPEPAILAGEHLQGWRLGLAFAGAYAGYIVAQLAGTGLRPDHILIGVFFVGLPLAGGRAARDHRRRSRERRLESEELERERDERAAAAVREDRERIAAELRDVVAHRLGAMVLQARAAQQVIPSDLDRGDAALAAVEDTGREALAEMRRVLSAVRAEGEIPALAPRPTLARAEALASAARAAGVDVALQVNGAGRELPLGVDLAACRVIEQGLLVVSRSGARHATVSVRRSGAELDVAIEHDGQVTSPGPLDPVRARVRLAGGRLDLHQANGSGPGRLAASLPVPGEPS